MPGCIASIVLAVMLASQAEYLHTTFANGTDAQTLAFVKAHPELVTELDDSDCTALHYAARYSRLETARWLIEQKADVNTRSYNDFTPLHMAEDGKMAALLIAAGAKMQAKDAWGKTPLQKAAQMERTDVCDAILAAGFPLDLASALWLKRRDAAKEIIEKQPEVVRDPGKDKDLWGNTTPLGIAASQGDAEMVRLLLKAGAPVNGGTDRPNIGTLTPLCNAVRAKHYDVAALLLEAGADPNATGGKFYDRLLDFAHKHSDQKMIDLLLKHGAKASP